MPIARHILTYAQTLQGGGVERAMLRLARGWVAENRRVTLVLGKRAGPLAAEVPNGVDVIELGSAWQLALRVVPDVVSDLHPDVIFCPGSHYTSVAWWTRRRLGADCPPIVGKVSNAPNRADYGAIRHWFHWLWLRLHVRFLDRIVAMTPATAEEIGKASGFADERIAIIPNPPATPNPEAVQTPLPEGRFILGVGRLAKQKRWDRLIAALPRLADQEVMLVILGEGKERARLLAQASALGIADRVVMPGHAADPMRAMVRAAVVALTSNFEGVPGVLREALDVGTPVVATESSASVAEIVTDPALGTVCARDDGDALVAALDHWLAPDAVKPRRVPQPGQDSAARYLELFDALVSPDGRDRDAPPETRATPPPLPPR